jgi:hypothetical protein
MFQPRHLHHQHATKLKNKLCSLGILTANERRQGACLVSRSVGRQPVPVLDQSSSTLEPSMQETQNNPLLNEVPAGCK